MDPLGKVVRELLRRSHESNVRGALELAKILRKDGMSQPQIEEMLCASGFEPVVISDAMTRFATKETK